METYRISEKFKIQMETYRISDIQSNIVSMWFSRVFPYGHFVVSPVPQMSQNIYVCPKVGKTNTWFDKKNFCTFHSLHPHTLLFGSGSLPSFPVIHSLHPSFEFNKVMVQYKVSQHHWSEVMNIFICTWFNTTKHMLCHNYT